MRIIGRGLCVSFLLSTIVFFSMLKPASAMWGAEIPVLLEILAKAIEQIRQLNQVIGASQETVSILSDMNRGIKEVLRLSDTAHVPLPPQVYEDAKNISAALTKAEQIYGALPKQSQKSHLTEYRVGAEGLFLSHDAFEYSSFLDRTGESVKRSAVISNQATATRLSAETLGVLLHAVSHTNRILAKDLELSSTRELRGAVKESASFDSFLKSYEKMESDFLNAKISPLNSFGGGK